MSYATIVATRTPGDPEGSGGRGPLLSLRALVLAVSAGCAVLVGVLTGSVEAGFGVGVGLLVAVHALVG